jgi:plasmid stability protein
MTTLTIRRLDEKTKTQLRVQAAHHGRSMEEEAREILRSALGTPPPSNKDLAEHPAAICDRRRVKLELPERDHMRNRLL